MPRELCPGTKNARYNTSEVIAWLEAMVSTSTKGLAAARAAADRRRELRSSVAPKKTSSSSTGLARTTRIYFGQHSYYSLWEQKPELNDRVSLAAYQKAREAWATIAARAKTVYAGDISYGSSPMRRGHWADRLAAIDADVEALQKHFSGACPV